MSFNKTIWLTDKDFNSMNQTEAYRADNFLITPHTIKVYFVHSHFGVHK